MKTNRTLIISIVIFFCLICLLISGIGYFYFANQPPSSLSNNSGYYIRGSKVYYLAGFPSESFEIESANASTFKIIDTQYAFDDARVYFNGSSISDADPSTFEVLDSPFSRDAKHVYVSGKIFTDDPASFEILDENISRDSQHIYWSTEIISDDPANLTILFSQDYYTYIKDSQTVFVNGNPIVVADADTFEVWSAGYGHDANLVYYFDQVLPADPNTFEIIEIPYSRDSETVFWMQNVISDADAQTFRVLNADFECSADSQTAFYQDKPIPNFDPNTIPANSQVTNCDANGIYFSP